MHAKHLAMSKAGLPADALWLTGSASDGHNVLDEAFVFWKPAMPNGAVAVVTVDGLLAFGAETSTLDGMSPIGKVAQPTTWLPADALNLDCGVAPKKRPLARGFDLRDGSALREQDVAIVADRAWATPLSQGVHTEYKPLLVLLYPRSMPFEPDHAEWVVIFSFVTHPPPR